MNKIFLILLLVSVFGTSLAEGNKPVVYQLNKKFMDILGMINKDLKSGKITQAQAKSYREQLTVIRKQESLYRKADSRKKLTEAQRTEITQRFDAIQASL